MKADSDSRDPLYTRRLPNLEREKVLQAALKVLNEVGFEGLTQRKLAEKLGVKAAALYWHFESKQDMINQLAQKILQQEYERALSEGKAPQPDTYRKYSWRDLLTGMALGMRGALMRYRDGALVIANADMAAAGESLRQRDALIAELLAKGMPPQLVLMAMFVVGRYTLGCVFEEQADPRGSLDEGFIKKYLQKLAEKHPDHAAGFRNMDAAVWDSEKHFLAGLKIVLDGIGQQMPK